MPYSVQVVISDDPTQPNYDKKRRCKEMSRVQRVYTVLPNDGGASQEVCLLKLTCGIIIWNV